MAAYRFGESAMSVIVRLQVRNPYFVCWFPTGTLCGGKDKHRCLVYSSTYCTNTIQYNTYIYSTYNNTKLNKKQTDMVLLISPKVGLGNNCFMLNVYDVVRRARRINRSNETIQNLKFYGYYNYSSLLQKFRKKRNTHQLCN